MTTVLNNAPAISQRTRGYADRMTLSNAMSVEVLARYGLAKPLPKNVGEAIIFRRIVPMEALQAPLVEGVRPGPTGFRYEDVSLTILQWGQWTPFTDVVMNLHEDPVATDISKTLGINAGRTYEQIIWNTIRSGPSVFYANGSSRSAVNTPLSLNLQRKIERLLQTNKAMKFTEVLDGSVKINTTPIEAAYIAVCHTHLSSDIRNMPGFRPAAEYAAMGPIMPYELGKVEDIRYVCSPDLNPVLSAGGAPGGTVLSTNGTNADVYPIIYMGQEAFGLVPLRNSPTMPGISVYMENPKPQKGDELGQTGFCSWKAWFNALILNSRWLIRAEVAAAALN